MAQFTLTTPTAVAVGSAVPFDNTIVRGGCAIRHRSGAGVISLVGGTCCHPAIYRVSFHGNVVGVAGAISLGIYYDGELLPETEMNVVPAATTDEWSVDAETLVPVDCGGGSLSVRVIVGATVTVNTASIIIEKE